MRTGVASDMPFTHTSPHILAGARQEEAEEPYERFLQILNGKALDLYVAAGHPKYDTLGQAKAEPEYLFSKPKDWSNLRSLARELGWEVIFGDENLMGIHSETDRPFQKRLVVSHFGDTTDTRAIRTHASIHSDNLRSSMQYQMKTALSFLNRSDQGFLLIIHLGRLPYLLKNELRLESIQETLHFYESMNAANDWIDQNGGWEETTLIAGSAYEYGLIWGSDSGSFPYSQINDRGPQKVPGFRINHNGPTAALTPLHVKGNQIEALESIADQKDPIYGPYFPLTDLHQWIREIPQKGDSSVEQGE